MLVGTDQEEVAHIMSRYDLVSLPVVDARGVLVGVITIDDVVDVLEEETTEDFQRFGGGEPLDRPYLDSGVLTVVRKRVGWLLLLFLTETLTGSVLRHFEEEMAAVVSLAFFIPLLIGTGGNAGSQTTSTIIRALAVEDLDRRGLWRPLIHEATVGVVLGGLMAVVAYGRALMWDTGQAVALTVAVAIFAIVVWANAVGSLLPHPGQQAEDRPDRRLRPGHEHPGGRDRVVYLLHRGRDHPVDITKDLTGFRQTCQVWSILTTFQT